MVAFIGRLDARQNFHQRALAGTIFANHGQHFTRFQIKVHVGKCANARECLREIYNLKLGWI